MNCSPFGQADFTAPAVLQAIRGELPQLHGLRLATTANSAGRINNKFIRVHKHNIFMGLIDANNPFRPPPSQSSLPLFDTDQKIEWFFLLFRVLDGRVD